MVKPGLCLLSVVLSWAGTRFDWPTVLHGSAVEQALVESLGDYADVLDCDWLVAGPW